MSGNTLLRLTTQVILECQAPDAVKVFHCKQLLRNIYVVLGDGTSQILFLKKKSDTYYVFELQTSSWFQ